MYVETMAYCLGVASELGVVTYTCHPAFWKMMQEDFKLENGLHNGICVSRQQKQCSRLDGARWAEDVGWLRTQHGACAFPARSLEGCTVTAFFPHMGTGDLTLLRGQGRKRQEKLQEFLGPLT